MTVARIVAIQLICRCLDWLLSEHPGGPEEDCRQCRSDRLAMIGPSYTDDDSLTVDESPPCTHSDPLYPTF